MVHLRIVVPATKSDRVMQLLEATASVSSLACVEGAARKPAGDLILCDVAREDASVLIDDLKELQIPKVGSIALEQIDSQLSEAAERAERAAPGSPSDAVQRKLYEKRRRGHLGDDSRAAAGLPTERSGRAAGRGA